MDDTLHIILGKLKKISSQTNPADRLILDDIKRLIEIEVSVSPQAMEKSEESFDGDDFEGSWWFRIRESFACWLVSH